MGERDSKVRSTEINIQSQSVMNTINYKHNDKKCYEKKQRAN